MNFSAQKVPVWLGGAWDKVCGFSVFIPEFWFGLELEHLISWGPSSRSIHSLKAPNFVSGVVTLWHITLVPATEDATHELCRYGIISENFASHLWYLNIFTEASLKKISIFSSAFAEGKGGALHLGSFTYLLTNLLSFFLSPSERKLEISVNIDARTLKFCMRHPWT